MDGFHFHQPYQLNYPTTKLLFRNHLHYAKRGHILKSHSKQVLCVQDIQ